MDKQKLIEKTRRAEKAEAVLKNELVKEYFEFKRNAIMHNLSTSKWFKKKENEELIRMLRLLGDFEKEFKQHIREGEAARIKLTKYFKG